MKLKIKNILKGQSVFLFIFMVLFPFGQIIKLGILQPIDLAAALGGVYGILNKFKRPEYFKYLEGFLAFAAISWLFSITIFPQVSVLYGLLYLLRLSAYIYFSLYVYNFAKGLKNTKIILDYLLVLSLVSTFFGWIQLMIFPDIKPMFVWGWDIHLYRLVGTYFDPAFIGLIIVFGLLISLYRYANEQNNKYLLIGIFLLISLALTYSRGSYLAFLTGLALIAAKNKQSVKILIFGIFLILIAIALPTTKNKSIELFRSFSAVNRIENYKQTLNIFKKSPVFGIGYDNMCIAYNKFVGFQKFSSHACSGSDSSILFIMTTTGITGLMILIYSLFRTGQSLKKSEFKNILIILFGALLIHSIFSNSLVYPWVMGFLIILLAASAI